MNQRQLSLIAGGSYLVIFFLAIFANFFALEAIINDPVTTVTQSALLVRLGAMAFLIAAVADIIVAWALYHMYRTHGLSTLSTYFRVVHAVIMGVAVYALLATLNETSAEAIMDQVFVFNTMWLIGLFFFGFHLILLARIVRHIRIIPYLMALAGVMYIFDTGAHFVYANYDLYADIFLALVAVPAIAGEMAFSLWLLVKGGKASDV